MDVKIEPSWKEVLADEFSKMYFEQLTRFVKEEYKKGAVYPAPKNIFKEVSSDVQQNSFFYKNVILCASALLSLLLAGLLRDAIKIPNPKRQ